MLTDILPVVRDLQRTLERIELFVGNDFRHHANELLYIENLDDLLTIDRKPSIEIPLEDPSPYLDILAKRLIRLMPPKFCNALVKTEDKKHYFGVIENEHGLFAVFVPISKGQKINIHSLKENTLEL